MIRAVLTPALSIALALLGCGSPPPSSPPSSVTMGPPAATPPPSNADDGLLRDEAPPPPPSNGETVTIKLVAEARRQAHVFWGRKDLGIAPVEITRPRGSGPLDLLVLAPGALPLHTRVFTDRGETLPLRFYGEKEATGLLGWSPSEPSASPAGDKKPRR